MSVQLGIWNFDGQLVTEEALERIGLPIAAFGPDGETSYVEASLGMSYRPFHTTRESRAERQPYVSNKGNVVTWDGRLDNRDELMETIETVADHSSDVSVVASAFDRWGSDCFSRLLGDWALAVWSPRERALILARDYIGTKQLFYRPDSHTLVWCSHLAALIKCEGHLSLCQEFIAGFLTSRPKAQLTPYNEIDSVEPGHFVRIENGRIRVQAYWAFNPDRQVRYKTDTEYEEAYRELFEKAVSSRLRTDSPILAELSGGYDSSSVVCMADEIISTGSAEVQRLDTFTFVDHEEPDEEDSIYSMVVEQKRGAVGHRAEIHQTGDAFSVEADEFAAVPGFEGRQEIKRVLPTIISTGGYRVILSGLGGDEFNGQALDFRLLIEDSFRRLCLMEAGKQLVAWSLDTRLPAIQILGQTLHSMLGRDNKQRSVEPWINSDFISRYIQPRNASRSLQWSYPNFRDGCGTVARYACVMTHRQPHIEERRYPFLDRPLVGFLMSIPLNQLLRPGERRSLMRRALRGILPDELLLRKTKAGAGRSLVLTVEKHWSQIKNTLLRDMLTAQMGIIDHDHFCKALVAMKHGTVPDRVVTLIKGLALELWLRKAVADHVLH